MTHVQLSNVAVLGMLASTIRDCNSLACTPFVLQYIEPVHSKGEKSKSKRFSSASYKSLPKLAAACSALL
jgi:hypothetical protein